MGRSLQLLVKGGKRNHQNKHCQTMKLFSILFCVGLSQAFLVRREADAEAKPEADAGHYGYAQGAVSAPVCNSVPVKTCNPRNVETPRKECHQEYDEIVDTTITEHCEEVVTTTCQQTSTQVHKSAAIVGHDSKVVATVLHPTLLLLLMPLLLLLPVLLTLDMERERLMPRLPQMPRPPQRLMLDTMVILPQLSRLLQFVSQSQSRSVTRSQSPPQERLEEPSARLWL